MRKCVNNNTCNWCVSLVRCMFNDHYVVMLLLLCYFGIFECIFKNKVRAKTSCKRPHARDLIAD